MPVSGYVSNTRTSGSAEADVTPATPIAEEYLPVRLTTGNAFYVASGGFGTGSDGTAAQGPPALLVDAWPVKLSDGVDVLGTPSAPLVVTGSVFVLNPGGAGGGDGLALSGSVVGLLIGGVPLSSENPLPISGSISVTSTGEVSQGAAATLGSPWPVIIVSGSDPVGTQTHPTWVTGSVAILNPSGASSNVTAQSGSVTGLLLGGVSVSSGNPLPISGPVTLASTTISSGSVSGLLVGGVALSSGNPVPVSGTIGLSGPITGTVGISSAVAAIQGPAAGIGSPWPVILVSGSDAVGTQTHPTWVTGSVFVLNPGGVGSTVTTQSGSVTGLLVGGVALSNANPVPVTGTIGLAGPITGSVGLSGPITGTVGISAPVTVVQGTPAGISSPWPVIIVSGSDPVGTQTHPTWVTGSVFVLNPGGVGSTVTAQSGSVVGLLLGGVAASNANPIPISDAGGSITIDGTVTVSSTVINSGSVTGLLLGGVAVSSGNPIPVAGPVTLASTTIASGSLSGLLVGGVPLAGSNPLPVTGTIGISAPITAVQGTPAAISAPWPVILVSGSDVVGTQTHPTWVTGSVFVLNPSSTSNVTVQSGSVTGLLLGGVAVSSGNPVPIAGAVTLASTTISSGSVTGLLLGGVAVSSGNPVPVNGAVTVASTVINSGSVSGLLIGGVALSSGNPVPVTGTVGLSGPITGSVGITSGVTVQSGSVFGLLLGGVAVSNANPVVVRDQLGAGALSIKVSGSTGSQLLFSASVGIIGRCVHNDSTAIMYVKYGADVSTDDFTTKLFPDDLLEIPTWHRNGRVDVLWTAATGSARGTEES